MAALHFLKNLSKHFFIPTRYICVELTVTKVDKPERPKGVYKRMLYGGDNLPVKDGKIFLNRKVDGQSIEDVGMFPCLMIVDTPTGRMYFDIRENLKK